MSNSLEQLKPLLTPDKRVAVLTGAGVSAESGIPTFRGGGQSVVWKGMPFDQISSARMVRDDLDAVWEWFDYRRGLYRECLPNPAHETLVGWEKRFRELTLITQNVDGLHERAGSTNVIELHGNINRSRCVGCGRLFAMKAEDVPHNPVDCDACGGRLRPDVVLFGEMLPVGAFDRAERKTLECDVFFIVGTSALVYPAAGLADIAAAGGALLVEVNPEETAMSASCDFSLRGNAGEILPRL